MWPGQRRRPCSTLHTDSKQTPEDPQSLLAALLVVCVGVVSMLHARCTQHAKEGYTVPCTNSGDGGFGLVYVDTPWCHVRCAPRSRCVVLGVYGGGIPKKITSPIRAYTSQRAVYLRAWAHIKAALGVGRESQWTMLLWRCPCDIIIDHALKL